MKEELQPQEVVIIEEPREPRSERKSDRFLAISILIAGVFVGGAIIFSSLYKSGATPLAPTGGTDTADNGGDTTGTVNTNIMNPIPRDAVLGSANAPVTIVEYGDYQCPFCSQFFSQTESQIVSDYINKGFAKMVFRNFAFLGAESNAAAAAAECANDQGKLWPYHDALYTAKVGDEQKGGGENDGFYNRVLFLQLAKNVGLDTASFTTCIDSGKFTALITKQKTDGVAAGVNSTPTFFVNGQQILGAQPYSIFKSTIDGLLKG